jgi:hypothetical protein
MRRVFVLFVILPLLVQGCAAKKGAVHAITAATPKIPEAADARMWPEVPVEDASAWPEETPPDQADATSWTIKASSTKPYIEAYTDKKSYLPGETIHFHVSTNAATYSIEILKEEWTRKLMAKVTGLPGSYYPAPSYKEQPWATGAKWPISYSWVVPDKWENGNYLALLRTTSGEYAYTYHPFIVRTRVPGSRSKVAFVMNYNTRNAYNWWGGKSLYDSLVPGDSHYAVAVSFLRPFQASYGRGNNYWGQWEVSSQLITDGFNPEFITEWDISSNPAILRTYDVLVFAGHHEYISCNTYDALEAHHHRGGHLAFFSANDIYWQVRFEDNGNKMVSYKSYASREDPMMGVDDGLVTTLWNHEPVNRPSEALQGICYVPYSYCFEEEDFVVQDGNHFMFEGTNLQTGDACGSKTASGETDFMTAYSPATMDVVLLARREQLTGIYKSNNYVQVDHVDVAAVYYEDSPAYGFPDGRGGQVFSAGTHSGWGNALLTSSSGYEDMRRITRNIVQHMVDAPPPPADFQGLGVLMAHWLDECGSPGWCEYADLDMSGTVDVTDLAHFARYWPGN